MSRGLRLTAVGQASGAGAVLLGALGALGWVTPLRWLARADPDYIPMAPSTALALVLLGAAAFRHHRRPDPGRRPVAAALVSGFAAISLLSFAAGVSPWLERWLVPSPELFGAVPTGRMSPLTAAGLLLAGGAFLVLRPRRGQRPLGDLGGLVATSVVLLSLAVVLGYAYRSPLLYGGAVIPMALTTALGLGCVGLSIVALAGPHQLPVRPFSGPSTSARLLRAFFPIVPVVILLEVILSRQSWINPALGSALSTLVLAAVVVTGVWRAARSVGGAVDRAEADRRRAEQARLESEARLRAFFESSAVGILFGDIHGRVLDANDALLQMAGYAREEVAGGDLSWLDLTPPEFLERDRRAIEEARARGACTPYEKQYLRKDGSRVWILVGFVLLEPERERSVAFVVDITSQKEAERALQRSENRFASIFRSSPLAIGIGEIASGRLVEVNDRCLEFFGYSREEMIGHTVMELGLWADPTDREAIVRRLESGLPVHTVEARFRRKGGEIRYGLVSMEALRIPSEATAFNTVVIADVTERKALESQFLQSQKMEAVGRLAGGIAHDFNNLLGVILGYAEILQRASSDGQRPKLEQILKAGERAARLTRQLLAFSRKQVLEPKVLDLGLLLGDLQKMLHRLIEEDVRLKVRMAPELWTVRADPGQVEQVVMNLCVNARDAIVGGGEIHIEVTNEALREGHAAAGLGPVHEPIPPGRYVRLAVSDTGSGIPRETLDHIFEPFFTTKEQEKGTGLGLSTVYGIVKQSGGFIRVYSEVGHGTTFKIYLPAVEQESEDRPAPEPLAGVGWETILLVEDEPALRAITRELLEQEGYRILEAGTGASAVEICRRYPETIHLLLTDVVMPGMDGRTLAARLTAERPDLRVLYMSGYTDDVIADRGVLDPGALLLSKPFEAAALLRRVREGLGRRLDRA
jgi:PAS domain S-box-containing protein